MFNPNSVRFNAKPSRYIRCHDLSVPLVACYKYVNEESHPMVAPEQFVACKYPIPWQEILQHVQRSMEKRVNGFTISGTTNRDL